MRNIYNLFYFFSIEQQKDDEEVNAKEINGKETNSKKIYDDDTQIQRRMVRSRRNKGITTRATVRQTRERVIFLIFICICILFILPAFKF